MGESASVGVVEACVSPCRPDENLAKDVADEGGDGGSTCQAARERGFQQSGEFRPAYIKPKQS